MYIIRSSGSKPLFVSIEKILNPENEGEKWFPVSFAWVTEKAEAVRFTTKWHARSVAKALPCGGVVIRVST